MDIHLFILPKWFYLSCVVVVTLVALWKGSWRAQVIAGSQLAQLVWHDVFCRLTVCRIAYHSYPPWRVPVEDGVLLAIALVCVVRARRYWVLWAASLSIVAIVTDLVALDDSMSGWATGSASMIWTYLLLALVLWDVALETGARRAAAQAATGSP